jgi:hypothetical protein
MEEDWEREERKGEEEITSFGVAGWSAGADEPAAVSAIYPKRLWFG